MPIQEFQPKRIHYRAQALEKVAVVTTAIILRCRILRITRPTTQKRRVLRGVFRAMQTAQVKYRFDRFYVKLPFLARLHAVFWPFSTRFFYRFSSLK